MPEKTEWAYLAGLIDGEGCFDLGIHLRTQKYKDREYRAMGCSPRLYIALKSHPINREVMEWLSKTFNIPIHENQGKFLVQFTGKLLEEVLQEVLPYLKIKGEEAKILLEALKVIKEKEGYWTLETAKKFAKLQDRLFAIRLRNGGHLRKWTGEKIVSTFEEIMKEREKAGLRVGVWQSKRCLNCGKELSKEQIWSKQKFCSHKCYVEFYKKHPELPRIAHEYVLICRKVEDDA
jgi:hypothetical protein